MASVNFGADVYVDGELEIEDDLTVGGQVVSLVDSIAPFVVTSTMLNENLNADLLDGEHGAYYLDLANATGVLGVAYGGTGLNSVGSAGQLLRSTGSGLEYFTHDFISSTLLGAVNGVATLDATGKVPLAQLPSMGMQYKGTWDASTNTPTLADGVGTEGDLYRVIVSGTVDFGSGNISFTVGDDVIYNGSVWERAPAGHITPDLQAVTDQGAVTSNSMSVERATNATFIVKETDTGSLAFLQASNALAQVVALYGDIAAGFWANSSGAAIQFLDTLTSNSWSLQYVSDGVASLDSGNQLRVQQDPVHDNDLARKLYVDTGLSAKFDIPTGTTSQYIRGDGSLDTFPTIPTVGNGVLTMSVGTGLTGSATFSANQSGNSTFTVGLGTNLANLNAVTNTGFLKRTGTNTWSVDTATYLTEANADNRYMSTSNDYGGSSSSYTGIDLDGIVRTSTTYHSSAINHPTGFNYGHVTTFRHGGHRAQLFLASDIADAFYYRQKHDANSTYSPWRQVSSRDWVDTNYYTKTASDAKYALLSNSVSAGNGLTGGGAISSNPSITLGTPGNITLASTNSVSSDSHTHAFVPGGSTSQYIRGDGSLATFPTIGDGTLTLAVGTGLTGSASFTANQSGNSTFTVGLGTNLANLNALSTSGFVKKTGANTWTIDTSTYLTSVALGDLTNVTLSSPTNGQVLTYNGSAWVNTTPPSTPTNYVTTDTSQTGLGGNKTWTGHHIIAPGNTSSPSTVANSVRISRNSNGSFMTIENGSAVSAVTLRAWNGGTDNKYQISLLTGGIETGNHGTSENWYTAWQRINSTNLGKTGNGIFADNTTLNSEQAWSDLPIGYSAFVYSNVGLTNGAPDNTNGYFTKVANRDVSGGWAGLWIDYAFNAFYVGKANTNTTFATWSRVLTAYTPTTLSSGQLLQWNGTGWTNWTPDFALASAIPTNYVTTDTNQSSLGGNKAWTGSQRWTLSSNVTPPVVASSISIGKATSGIYLIAYDNDANQAFVLRTYAASNYQLTLDKGGVETPNHGNSSQWNTAYSWVNTYGSGLQGGPYVPTSRTVSAGNGLTGGGALSGNVTVTLGTPGNITLSSSNSVSTNSHTHAFVPGGNTSQYIRGDGTLATFPTIPTVNNGTLTLNTSGSGLSGSASFSANQSGNSTFTVSVASGYTIPNNDQVSHWEQAYGWVITYGSGLQGGPYVPTSRTVSTAGSLTGGGNLGSNRTLQLVNDNGSPGNNKYYGTNNAGVKGFYDLPSGGGGGVSGSGINGYIPLWTSGSSISNSVLQQSGINLSTSGSFTAGGLFANDIIQTPSLEVLTYIRLGAYAGPSSPSAMFEISSTSKGFLMPRMNNTQITSIPSPAEGLMVYSTDEKAPCWFDGNSWWVLYGQYTL